MVTHAHHRWAGRHWGFPPSLVTALAHHLADRCLRPQRRLEARLHRQQPASAGSSHSQRGLNPKLRATLRCDYQPADSYYRAEPCLAGARGRQASVNRTVARQTA